MVWVFFGFFSFLDHGQKNMLKTRLVFRGSYSPPIYHYKLVFRVWSLLLHQAASQLPGRLPSTLLPVPVCHCRHITLQPNSHASCQNPTQCEPAHPEFSADLISFTWHRSEMLSTAGNPFRVKGLLPPSEQLPAIAGLFPELDAW